MYRRISIFGPFYGHFFLLHRYIHSQKTINEDMKQRQEKYKYGMFVWRMGKKCGTTRIFVYPVISECERKKKQARAHTPRIEK